MPQPRNVMVVPGSPSRWAFSSARKANRRILCSIAFLVLSGPLVPAAITGGEIDLRELAARSQLNFAWTERGEKAAVRGKGMDMRFTGGSRQMQLGGMRVFLGDAVSARGDSLYLTRVDYETFFQPLLFPRTLNSFRPVRTVAIDPGHGGRDPGTRSTLLELEEKNLALAVAHRLKRSLEAEGFRVVLTRQDDRFVELTRRSKIANQAGADLFVSIHFNAVGNPAIEGTETYVLTPAGQRSTSENLDAVADTAAFPGNQYDSWNTVLAFVVHRQLLHDLGGFDRGLKRARFQVLRGVECPALLVEAGYLSNPREARRMAGSRYQEQMVESLTLAIMHFRDTVDKVASNK